MTLETCCECDAPTGRAGKGEDSLYVDDNGPYCEGCWEDVCGLCGRPGANKIPHPIHWPGEAVSETGLVHADCEHGECGRAHAQLSDAERAAFLRAI